MLFSGDDGTLYLNYKGTGKIAYERNCSRCYPYIFDCAIEEGMWNNIQLICDKKDMSLYLNGSFAGTAKYYNAAGVKQESSTFVLPVTEIGKGVSGMMRSLTVWNRALSDDEASGVSKLGEENLALKKKVTVSGLEVQGALTGEMAVDGDPATRASLERKHDSWLYVDLGEVRTVGRIEFDWAHRPNKFNLQVSEDGQTWTVVYEDLNCAGNTEGRDVFTLPSPVRARYVKYNQIEMFNCEYGQFSGTFYEMEVYENRYSNADVIAQAKKLIDSTPKTAENETFLERFAQNIDLAEKVTLNGTEAETAIALRQLQAQTESLRAGDVSAKQADLSALYALLTAKEDLNLFSAQSAAVDAAANAILSAIDGLEVCPLITVTTNKVVYQNYSLEKLIDNDQSSICWLQDEQRAGDWVQFRFRAPTALGKVRLLSTMAGSDIIGSADFQISSDGKNWKTVGKLTSLTDQSITFSEEKVIAARILLTGGKGNWLKMNEIIFNDTVLVDTARLETATRKSVDEFAYTPASYEQYAAALAAAREVLAKSNPTQSEIDSAEQALTAAYGNLVAVEPGDKSILERTVAAAEQLVSSGWADSISAAERERFTAALDRAKAVLADKRAGQPSINNAEEALRAAMPAVVAGDANGDGAVNIVDVLCMRKHLAGDSGAISIANADIDGNGRVEVADVLAVRAGLAGQN